MELIETIMVAMMAGMTNTIIGILWTVLQSTIYLIVNVSIIDDFTQLKSLDRYLALHGICLVRNYDYTRMPESGYHFAISWKWIIPNGILIAYKSCDRRTVYWIGPGMHDLRIKIIGNPNLVYERYITMLSPTDPSIMVRRINAPDSPNQWQSKIVDLIISDYNKNQRGSWIVCGPPGCGKTTLGLIVAKRLIGPGVCPTLVTGVDFETPGLSIKSAYYKPIPTEPVILMLNEFDCSIRHAERAPSQDSTGARETICIAHTPTIMLNTLDYIMSTPHLIVIATTNMKQSDLVTGIYQRYTRAGRFDNHYQVSSNDITGGPSKPAAAGKPKRGRAKTSRQ